jgi:hypothetical protein
MNKRIIITAFITMVTCFSLAITATGSSLLQQVQATLNKEFQMVLNGGPWEMKSDDKTLYPITYEGRTYLPVRSVAEALHVPIVYEASSKKIYIGEKTDKVPILSESYRPVSSKVTEDGTARLINGTDYGKVALFAKVLHSNSYIQLEPDAKYSKLVLYVDVDDDDVELKINNRSNGANPTVIQSDHVTEGDGLQEITVDITGIKVLSVDVMTAQPNSEAAVRIAVDKSYYQ